MLLIICLTKRSICSEIVVLYKSENTKRLYYEILRSLLTLDLSYFPHIIFFPVETHTFRVYVRVSHDLRKSLAHHRKISMDTFGGECEATFFTRGRYISRYFFDTNDSRPCSFPKSKETRASTLYTKKKTIKYIKKFNIFQSNDFNIELEWNFTIWIVKKCETIDIIHRKHSNNLMWNTRFLRRNWKAYNREKSSDFFSRSNGWRGADRALLIASLAVQNLWFIWLVRF